MSKTGRRRWPRVLAGVASCLVLATTGLAAAGQVVARQIGGNIKTIPRSQDVQTDTTGPVPGAPINILVMGSDTRSGRDAKGYGHSSSITGARSDTTILLHVSGDRTRALGVSIPRDSKVMLPSCTNKQGRIEPGIVTRFNEAFDIGGPNCTVKAVEQLTGVHINHFVVVDFAGFKNVVNAIGGVDVCMSKPVNDPESKLRLPAGHSLVRGEQALAFVRARYKLGDGSDIGRIDRQQEFISSAIRKATSLGVITNPVTLYRLLDAATKSISVDQGLNLNAMKDLATNVQDIRPSDIAFTTVPWRQNSDHATISWVPDKANVIWQSIITDSQWPPKPAVGADGKVLTVAPSAITVNVLNGTSTPGAAARVAASLRALGYNVETVANAPGPVTTTTITSTTAGAGAARTLSAAFGGTPASLPRVGRSRVLTLTVGPDYKMPTALVIATPKAKVPTAATTNGELSVHTADAATCS